MYRLAIHLIAGFVLAALFAAPETSHAVDFAAMECGSLGQPACSVAPATYESQKPKGCPDGSFFDPINGGSCWSCPSGTVRQVTPVDSGNACLRPPGETTARAKRNGRGRGLIGTDCPKGQFWDPNGYCWSCPSGYARTAAPVPAKNACTKWRGPSFARATLRKRLACPDGSFFDPIRDGSCWSCPEGYVRTLVAVNEPNACAAGNLVAGASPVSWKVVSPAATVDAVSSVTAAGRWASVLACSWSASLPATPDWPKTSSITDAWKTASARRPAGHSSMRCGAARKLRHC